MSLHLPKSPSWSISENCSLQLPQTWNSKVFLLQKKLDFTVNWWLLNSRFHGVISPSWTTAAVNRSTIETTTTKISRRTQSWDFRFQAKASCDGLSLNPNWSMCANREMKIGQISCLRWKRNYKYMKCQQHTFDLVINMWNGVRQSNMIEKVHLTWLRYIFWTPIPTGTMPF